MRSDSRAVKQAVKRHIIDSFDDVGTTPEEAFVGQVDYLLKGGCRGPRDALDRMIQGGMFLVYDRDIMEYLGSIGMDKYSWERIRDLPQPEAEKVKERANGLYRSVILKNGSDLYEKLKGTGLYRGK